MDEGKDKFLINHVENDEEDRLQFALKGKRGTPSVKHPPCALLIRHRLRGHVEIFTAHSRRERYIKVNSPVTSS
jgi:hypothetical protein